MKNEMNALIMEAMKNHDSVRTETLRAIKSAFLNWQTSKENAGKELTDADEIQMTFLPKAASEEDILRAFRQAKDANGWEAEKKNMGLFVKAIKAALPNADGKMVAQVVQSQLA